MERRLLINAFSTSIEYVSVRLETEKLVTGRLWVDLSLTVLSFILIYRMGALICWHRVSVIAEQLAPLSRRA